MSFDFILAQVFGLVSLVLTCISYFQSNKKVFLFFQIASTIFYAGSFLSLQVYVGGIGTIVSVARLISLYLYEKKNKEPPLILMLFFMWCYLLTGVLLFQGYLYILSIVSNLLCNYAMFSKSINRLRVLMILPNCMLLVYNLLSRTYTNAILDFVELIILLCSIYKFRRKIVKNDEKI